MPRWHLGRRLHDGGGGADFGVQVQQDEVIRMEAFTGTTASNTTAATSVGYPSLANSQTPLVPQHAITRPSLARTASSSISHVSRPFTNASSTVSVSGRSTSATTTPSDFESGSIFKPSSSSLNESISNIETSKRQIAQSNHARTVSAIQKERRKWLKDPISTVTSSIIARTRPRKKREKDLDDGPAGLSSTSSGFEINERTLTVKTVTAKHSDSPISTIDQELGYGDGKGNEGVLRRVYDTWALTAIATANIGPIAGAFFGVRTAKEYGGYSMLAIGWPLSGLCMCFLSAALAEFASSYPVAGAMWATSSVIPSYTWTFRMCRLSPVLRPLARFLSWLCGSLLLCGHILVQMVLEWQLSITFQGLIIVYAQNYVPTVWRTIFFAWAALLISAAMASTSFGRSPLLWKGVSLLLLSTSIILIVSLFACAKYRNSAHYIFTEYANTTGFTRKGYVYLLGWVLTSIATGQDVAAHLAEEAKYPTKTVPKAIFWSTAISYLAGWALSLSLMAVPRDTVSVSSSPARDYGAAAQTLTSVLPRSLAFFILILVILGMQFQDIAQLLASSRFIWALARDSAIPGSSYLSHLSMSSRIPVRATWAVCFIVSLSLMLIATSRSIVTNLMLEGGGAVLVLAYGLPVVCYLTCGKGALDVDGRNDWTLRGWSRYVAYIALAYTLLIIILISCPTDWPITATSFSYAACIVVVVSLLSSITWITYGNAHYAGPIKSITVYTIGREVDLPKSSHAHSTNKPSAKPSIPIANVQNNGATTTDLEVGKTANLYSESLPTLNWSVHAPAGQLSSPNKLRRKKVNGLEMLNQGRETEFTDTQLSDITNESWTGSEGSYESDDGESTEEEDRKRIPSQTYLSEHGRQTQPSPPSIPSRNAQNSNRPPVTHPS